MSKYSISLVDSLRDKQESKLKIFFASATVLLLLVSVYILAIMFGGN